MSNNNENQLGPVYGVPLIDEMPLGNSYMVQAMPSRADLEQVRRINERVAAGYEVLLHHYHRAIVNAAAAAPPAAAGWIHHKQQKPPRHVRILYCNPPDEPSIAIWAGGIRQDGVLSVIDPRTHRCTTAEYWQPLPAMPQSQNETETGTP